MERWSIVGSQLRNTTMLIDVSIPFLLSLQLQLLDVILPRFLYCPFSNYVPIVHHKDTKVV